jgi:hypothetical protein
MSSNSLGVGTIYVFGCRPYAEKLDTKTARSARKFYRVVQSHSGPTDVHSRKRTFSRSRLPCRKLSTQFILFRRYPWVQAKIEATGLVEVSFPFCHSR